MESSDWEAECKSAHDPFSYVNTSTGAAAAAKAEKHVVWVPGALIVGGGPSGLAVAACLKARGVPSTVLERSGCVASLWQLRTYDRLRLHLPKRFCELPLMPFPSWFPTYPSKQQFVGYLEAYAEAFGVRPRFNETVVRAEYDGALGLWRVRSSTASKGEGRCTAAAGVEQEITEYLCRWLVVATGENAEPVVPEIEGMEGFEGAVLHTSLYRSGGAFRNKRVLVVGCGNSGMEVCLDLCNHGAHPSMVVRDSVHILPREILGFSTFGLSMLLLEWLPLLVVDRLLLLAARLTFGDTSKFSLCRPQLGPLHLKSLSGKTPVLDVGALANIKSGDIKVRPALKSLTKHGAEFVDGRSEEFDAVIFATGYKSNVPCWLKEKKFFSDRDGLPRKPFPNGWKGEKGLYAVGFTKRGLLGASLDAMSIAQDIEQSWKSNYGEKLTPLAHPSVI